jgi:hypothetical protein
MKMKRPGDRLYFNFHDESHGKGAYTSPDGLKGKASSPMDARFEVNM